MDEDFEARRMTGEFEQPQNADDGEKLEDISLIYAVCHAALQQDVGVETESRHEVDHVYWRLDELHEVWTDLKAVPSL